MSDYGTQIRDAFPELHRLDAEPRRNRVIEAWKRGLQRGGWRHIEDIPYAWNIDAVTNVEHIRGVTQIALDALAVQQEFHNADVDRDVVIAASLLHDVGKCYEYVDYVDDDLVDPDRTVYADAEIPHSISGYALAHEVGCSLAVQRAIPHVVGEVPRRTVEAELVKSANAASGNAITQSTMGISLPAWIEEYSQTQ